MPQFSDASQRRLDTCHPDLIRLFERVILTVDCAILEGHRGEAAQNEAHRTGRSQLKWPDGNHNKVPSLAVDVAPHPIDWDELTRWHVFAGYVLGVASEMGISVRSGLDWDGDWSFVDQSLVDAPHFEILTAPAAAVDAREPPLAPGVGETRTAAHSQRPR